MGNQNMKNQQDNTVNKKIMKEIRQNYTQYIKYLFTSDFTEGFKPEIKPTKQSKNFISEELQNVQGSVLEKVFGKQDMKIKINNPLEYPYSAIGIIIMKHQGQQQFYQGTGFLIAPNVVFTCAHNLYDFKLQKKPFSEINFYLATKKFHGRNYQIKNVYYKKQFQLKGELIYNYGILELEQKIGHFYGWFGVDFRQANEQGDAIISGYPLCIEKIIDNQIKQVKVNREIQSYSGVFKKIDSYRIKYDIDTFLGNSGSPIYRKQNQKAIIFGIDINGPDSNFYNQGYLISKQTKNDINQWLMQITGTLDLRWNEIGIEGAQYIAKSLWPNLNTINLRRNNIGDNGVEYIAKIHLPNLNTINLRNNKIGYKGAQYISKANWTYLHTINLRRNNLGDKGAKYIAQAHWPYLKTIYLYDNNIGDNGVQYIANAKRPNLHTIQLWNNNITDKGVEYISRAQWPNLQAIDLRDNKIGDKGVEYITKASWTNLNKIDIQDNKISDLMKQILKQKWAFCSL